MKRLIQVAAVFAMAFAAGAAFAQSRAVDYWRSGAGDLIWKNGTQELCWRDANWTPASAVPGCDGAIFPHHHDPAAVNENPPPPPPPLPLPCMTGCGGRFYADAFFDFDKAVLKPEGKAALDDLLRRIKDYNLEVLVAVGHTDAIGSVAYNWRLSERRAEAVKAYLMSKGIDGSRIYTEGKGKSQPMATNKTREGRVLNRRVEIVVVALPRE